MDDCERAETDKRFPFEVAFGPPTITERWDRAYELFGPEGQTWHTFGLTYRFARQQDAALFVMF